MGCTVGAGAFVQGKIGRPVWCTKLAGWGEVGLYRCLSEGYQVESGAFQLPMTAGIAAIGSAPRCSKLSPIRTTSPG